MNIKTKLSQIFKNKNVRFWGLQVCLALFLLFAGIYAVLLSLDGFTRHGEFIVVPDLELPKQSPRAFREEPPALRSKRFYSLQQGISSLYCYETDP